MGVLRCAGMLVVAASLVGACGTTPEGSAPVSKFVAAAMLQRAQAGAFQAAPAGHHYQGPVKCRVDRRRHAFRGEDIYLCKIAISDLKLAYLWEWGAWVDGKLHTHATDPTRIPTITGAFDPPF
jgi:hypothetical protein